MYIDVALTNDFMKRYPRSWQISLEDIIEECGIWYSADGIRAECEDFEMSLEEIYSAYYFVIEENKMFFVNPDVFWDDVEEFFSST